MKIDTNITTDILNERNKDTMADALGIEITELAENYLKGKMPVNKNSIQPLGLLHGGASAALAETVGSMAAYCTLDREKYYCVGLEIKCNHLKSVRSGYLHATAFPLHTGRRIQVWKIEILNDDDQLICFSILTMAVIEV